MKLLEAFSHKHILQTHKNAQALMDLCGDMMVIREDGWTKTLQPHSRQTDLCGTLTQRFSCSNDFCSVSFWPPEIPSCSCCWGKKREQEKAEPVRM